MSEMSRIAQPIQMPSNPGDWRALLPYTPPVGNQVVTEQQTTDAAKIRQAQQSVQLTDFTYVQQTDGEGVGAFTVAFDVAFTAEPVVSHGLVLADFAAEIREDLEAAIGAAADAQDAADEYQWKFDRNITIGAFQPYDDGQHHFENTPYKFAIGGFLNSTFSDGRKASLVVTDGQFTYVANLSVTTKRVQSLAIITTPGETRVANPIFQDAIAAFGTVSIPHLKIEDLTWQLLADGVPLTAIGGFDTSDTHKVEVLSAAAIQARQQAQAAGENVDGVLKLGAGSYPFCDVYVKRWLLNNQKNYIGAECIVVVKTCRDGGLIPPIDQAS